MFFVSATTLGSLLAIRELQLPPTISNRTDSAVVGTSTSGYVLTDTRTQHNNFQTNVFRTIAGNRLFALCL